MARKTAEAKYVQDILHPSEIELFEYARSGDWFIQDGYKKYGEDWPHHIPRAPNGQPLINIAAQYLFGWNFQEYQAPLYYCPIQDILLHGGRGSGKTDAFAITWALRATFNPGYNWLHTAPSIEQARVVFNVILEKGQAGNWYRLFHAHDRTAPAPDIELKPWDANDPGTLFMFRSQGGHGGQPMELLRSMTAGFVTSDESFRVNQDDFFVRILTGIARGPNWYTLNANPELKKEYDDRVFEIQTEANPKMRRLLQEDLDKWVEASNVSKRTVLSLTGNAGPWFWEWARYKYGKNHPERRWSATWTSDMNAYFTSDQRGLLEMQFEDDPDGLRVEMLAERPRAMGDIFVQDHLDNLFDERLKEEALTAVEEEMPGWIYQKHQEFGLVRYQRPQVEKKAVYAAGGDPGTGRVPHRNKWVNLVARIDRRPFEIVYMRVGNLSRRGQGSIKPWIADCQHILAHFRMPEAHFAAEAGATQKNVHEVVWPDNLFIVPLNMNMIKAQLIMQAQLMLQANLFVSPHIELMEQELAGYQLNDRKIDQDFVMAFLALVYVVWPYVADEFDLPGEQEDSYEDYWENQDAGDRDIRLSMRDIRGRR